MNSLSGCIYSYQLEDESWVQGDHIFEDKDVCFNCGAKKLTTTEQEIKQEAEVVEEAKQTQET